MNLQIKYLNLKFVMIYIILKMLALLKNHLNYLKIMFFIAFFRSNQKI